jgi:hypothetical protein
VRTVFFDESGNTGQNLLDINDPIFALASCSFPSDKEQELLSLFDKFRGPELKFSRLKRTPSGQNAVLSFLRSPEINSASVGVVIFHKPFTIVSKYCDVVLEPSFQKAGIDFYERGLNLATANLLSTTMPTFLNPSTWRNFLSLFVRVIRERTPAVFREWQRLSELIYNHLEHANREVGYYFAPVLLLTHTELFEVITEDELDPIAPAYYVLANHWGKLTGKPFEVRADESKVLVKTRGHLLKLSDSNVKPFTAGYDRRTMDFPLKVNDIVAVDSKTHLQIQFADILSGAIASAAKAQVNGALAPNSFARQILEACFSKGVIVDALWPSRHVTPSALGTDVDPGPSEISLPQYTAMILKEHPFTRTTPSD